MVKLKLYIELFALPVTDNMVDFESFMHPNYLTFSTYA